MKTNKILMAMALAAGFTACTSEELVETTQNTLNNRKVLGDLEFVMGDAESRFAAGDNGFVSTDGDGFGVALVDVPNGGANANLSKNYDIVSYIQTNYKFAKGEGNTYNTTARMVEGNYVFYAPYNEKHLSRKPIEVVTPITQTLDVLENGDADKYSTINNILSSEEANPMFVSYQFLPAVDQDTKLNLTLKHIFAYPEVTIANNKTEDVTITKYVIKTEKSFPIKDALSNSGVKTHLYNWGAETTTNAYGSWVSKTAQDKKWLVGSTSDILTAAADAPQSDIIVVEIPEGLTIPAGGEQTFHVVMPGQAYTGGYEAYAYVNNSEGFILAGSDKTMTFNPGQRYPKEEFTNSGNASARAGEMMTVKIGKTQEVAEISVLFPVVVSTTKELEEAVLNGTEKFRVIPISDEVAIDETIVDAMRQVNFQGMEIDGDIIIEGGETATTALELKENVEVKGIATIKGLVKLNKTGVVIASAKVAENASMEIANAEVGSIENYGIVNIKQEGQDVNVTNYATLNIEKKGYKGTYTAGTEILEDEEGETYTQVVETAVVNVNAEYASTATKFEGTWNVKANMSTSNAATIYGDMTVDANKVLDGAKLTVNANATLTVSGRVNNDIELAGNYVAATDEDEEIIEVAKLVAKSTSFIKSSVTGEDNVKDVNLLTIEDGAYFFSMKSPLSYNDVTAEYKHVGNVSENSDLVVPSIANSLVIEGTISPSTEESGMFNVAVRGTGLAYEKVTINGDIMTNNRHVTVGGKVVKVTSVETIDNTVSFKNVRDLDVTTISAENGKITLGQNAKSIKVANLYLEDVETMDFSSVSATIGNITARASNIYLGEETIFSGGAILMDKDSRMFFSTDNAATTTAELHVEGNVSLSAIIRGYSDGTTNAIMGAEVSVYNGKTLTIEKDATIMMQALHNGQKVAFNMVDGASHDDEDIDTTADANPTGKVVNYGKVYHAKEFYGGATAAQNGTAVAAKSWWTAKSGSVCWNSTYSVTKNDDLYAAELEQNN